MQELESSKENIQPIQQGRKVDALRHGLSVHTEDVVLQRQREFERELRTYSGDDPLSVWWQYVKWVEQNFPKGGRDGHLAKLVHQCLSVLRKEEHYYDDPRFVDVFLKYARMCDIPLEVYSYMYSHRIGLASAQFYAAWGWELEQRGNNRDADKVLSEGLRRNAQPSEVLKFAHSEFQFRVANKVKLEQIREREEPEAARNPFQPLKPQKKGAAPVSRVGSTVLENGRAAMTLGHKQPQPRNFTSNTGNAPFKIYSSEAVSLSSLPVQSENAPPTLFYSDASKENDRKPGKWNKAKVKIASVQPSACTFQFHCDDVVEPPLGTLHKPVGMGPALSMQQKRPSSPPIALFEPTDHNKVPVYNKMKVYGGTEEFSLEEIRAAAWHEKQKRLEEEKRKVEEEREKELLRDQIRRLTEEVNYLKLSLPGKEAESKGKTQNMNENSQKLGESFHVKPSSYEAVNMLQELYNGTMMSIREEATGTLPRSITTQEREVPTDGSSKQHTASEKPVGFVVYRDPTEVIPPSNHFQVQDIYSEEASKENESPDKEDIENVPPKGYIQEKTQRELAGILEPSKNIFYMPLEEQEKLEDDFDEDDDFMFPENRHQEVDDTLYPPANTEQFASAAFSASTPYMPRVKEDKPSVPEPVARTNDLPPVDAARASTEKKINNRQSIPGHLSVIVETSAENYKSSSSSGSSANSTKLGFSRSSSQHHSSAFHRHVSTDEPVEQIGNVKLYHTTCEPFGRKFTDQLLSSLQKPFTQADHFHISSKSITRLKSGTNVKVSNSTYIIDSTIGEGVYAKVYLARIAQDDFNLKGKLQKQAFKVCKDGNEWEFYACLQVHQRLAQLKELPDVSASLMKISNAVKYADGILLAYEYAPFGTLIDVINVQKQKGSAIPELVAMYLTLEMLHIVSKLHRCNMIHADIKPDNFLLVNSSLSSADPASLRTSHLRLIDFGRAIDLTFFKPGVCFTTVVNTSGFQCTEMKENKPWVFQPDWYGVLGSIHVLLFSEYMKVQKNADGKWEPVQKFRRYWFTDLWVPLFSELLNNLACYQEPNIELYVKLIEGHLKQNARTFKMQAAQFDLSFSYNKNS